MLHQMGQLPTWLPRLAYSQPPGAPQYLSIAQYTIAESVYWPEVHTCTFAPRGVIELLEGGVRAGFCYTLYYTERCVNIYVLYLSGQKEKCIVCSSCSSDLLVGLLWAPNPP